MMGGGQIETWLAAGYSILLALFAVCLEAIARRSHHRTKHYELAGFRYRPHLDQWECPTGQPLTRVHTDLERRIAQYRASAHICNSCPLKMQCTDSDSGRELKYQPDSWLRSELCRFQRGMSLVLLFLATLVLLVEIARSHSDGNLSLLVAVLVPIGAMGVRTAAQLRSR